MKNAKEKKMMDWLKNEMRERYGKEWKKVIRNMELVYEEDEFMFVNYEYKGKGEWKKGMSILP